MGVSEETIDRLKADYPGLTVVARQSSSASSILATLREWFLLDPEPGPVSAVKLTIEGIRGGGRTSRRSYEVIVDTTNLRKAIPPVWVVSPDDRSIEHVNIWRAHKSHCRWSGSHLPSLCWNTFESNWLDADPTSRTLGAALEYVKQLLNVENHDSPAR